MSVVHPTMAHPPKPEGPLYQVQWAIELGTKDPPVETPGREIVVCEEVRAPRYVFVPSFSRDTKIPFLRERFILERDKQWIHIVAT